MNLNDQINLNVDMIKDLIPEKSRFTIKITVVKKSDIRDYKSKKGD